MQRLFCFFYSVFFLGANALLDLQLNSLQNQNAAFSQRENELLSKISLQEALQIELDGVKEVCTLLI